MHLKRGQSLAQRGFKGGFPSWLDMDARPQPRHALEPMARQPRLNAPLRHHLVLQRLERVHARDG
ncbi:hypothetical protein [Thiomonas sp. FB-Cd]|uniref:hypothetical protein n=1 Tax=Thiomonas sp. FB-Cd TaxID=1158292 RepID=UPI000570305D|nr:hypothetical protein [Thiomonas sp. FB-Cd]